jgi:hypothetical protein
MLFFHPKVHCCVIKPITALVMQSSPFTCSRYPSLYLVLTCQAHGYDAFFGEICVCILFSFSSHFSSLVSWSLWNDQSLIAFCCQTASRAGPAQLTRQSRRHVWVKNMVKSGGGTSGRRDKLLRLLSVAKLLAEGGGGKPNLCVGWQETPSRPSYASVYFSKSLPWSTVAGHWWPPITVTHLYIF